MKRDVGGGKAVLTQKAVCVAQKGKKTAGKKEKKKKKREKGEKGVDPERRGRHPEIKLMTKNLYLFH